MRYQNNLYESLTSDIRRSAHMLIRTRSCICANQYYHHTIVVSTRHWARCLSLLQCIERVYMLGPVRHSHRLSPILGCCRNKNHREECATGSRVLYTMCESSTQSSDKVENRLAKNIAMCVSEMTLVEMNAKIAGTRCR